MTGIKETCIYVNNLEVTRQFYQDKLGLPLISLVAGRHVFFRAGSSVLLCFIADTTLNEKNLTPHGAKGIVHFAFEVESKDYAEAYKSIVDLGIEILDKQTWRDGLQSFYFSDPDNNLLEIIEKGVWD